MHLKRAHSAINKIISIDDNISDISETVTSALTYPEICNVSTNNFEI